MVQKWSSQLKEDQEELYCESVSNSLDLPNFKNSKIKRACQNYVKRFNKKPSKRELVNWIKETDPVIEGQSFENVAVVDTGTFMIPLRFASRFINYCNKLGKKGKLIIPSPVLAELQKMKVINKTVQSNNFRDISKELAKIVEKSELDPEILDTTKRELLKLMGIPSLTVDNIKIVNVKNETMNDLAEDAVSQGKVSTAYKFKVAYPFIDRSLIAATIENGANLVFTLDKAHLESKIDDWRDITKNDALMLITNDRVGDELD